MMMMRTWTPLLALLALPVALLAVGCAGAGQSLEASASNVVVRSTMVRVDLDLHNPGPGPMVIAPDGLLLREGREPDRPPVSGLLVGNDAAGAEHAILIKPGAIEFAPDDRLRLRVVFDLQHPPVATTRLTLIIRGIHPGTAAQAGGVLPDLTLDLPAR
ncbi:MAG: hypothetical protein AB7K09_20870 [Planctomycetota bacterium]